MPKMCLLPEEQRNQMVASLINMCSALNAAPVIEIPTVNPPDPAPDAPPGTPA
jgi:hypothetical protein